MNDKQRVVARLEGRKIPAIVMEYYELENKISELLSEKETAGDVCRCGRDDDNFGTVKFVHEGHTYDEIIELCVKCGGYVER